MAIERLKPPGGSCCWGSKIDPEGTFGAKKYARGNWLKVDKGLERYEDALWRHLLQHGKDPESGLDHLAHAAWNILALITLHHKEKIQ